MIAESSGHPVGVGVRASSSARMLGREAFSPGMGTDAGALGSPSQPLPPAPCPRPSGPAGLLHSGPLQWSFQTRTLGAARPRIGRPDRSAPPSPSSSPSAPVSRAWHGGPICFQSGPALSAPSSGLWRGWGASATVLPHSFPWTPSGREASAPEPLPYSGLGGERGDASPYPLLGLRSHPDWEGNSAPSPTSCIWVCLGSPPPPRPASSLLIRCHGHDQSCGSGEQGRGSQWDQASGGRGLGSCPPWGAPSLNAARTPAEALCASRWGSPLVPPPHFRPGPIPAPPSLSPGPSPAAPPPAAPPLAPPPGRAPQAEASPESSLRAALRADQGTRGPAAAGPVEASRGPGPISEPRGECARDPLPS